MRRMLLAIVISLFALSLSGAALAGEEKTVEKNIALAMTFTGDEAAINDYVHAMMLVNSLRALGGVIELDGDKLVLKLDLGPEQLDALRKALSEEHAGLGMLTEPRYTGEYAHQARSRHARIHEPGSHERFLLGKKHDAPCEMKKEMKVIVRGDAPKAMHQEKRIIINEECCKLAVICPHCGKPVEVDVPMPEMPHMPDMPMPPGKHPEAFRFRMHPDGEFAPPHPPMPDMDAMRERMGPMMEDMERMHRERGDMERRFGEMERALDEFHRHLGPRDEERDREFWRAIEELHRALEDRDRERDREFDELWRALDELFMELEELERELD